VPNESMTPDRAPVVEALQRELERLRRRVDELTSPRDARRLDLRAVRNQPFLGQDVTLIATVTQGDGRPAPNAPVTLFTTRGILRTSDASAVSEGRMIMARTGLDGRLRAVLSLPTSESLSSLQRSALSVALASLGEAPATPAEAAAGLAEMARQYAWEINVPLRQAVDVYARDFAPDLLESATPRDAMSAWGLVDCGLLAFVPVDAAAGALTSTAALSLPFINWIAAFLTTALTSWEAEEELRNDLDDLAMKEGDARRLIDSVYVRAGDFVTRQRGALGAYVGRKVAQSAIRRFVEDDVSDRLPLEVRATVLDALNVASHTIAATDVSTLGGLSQARTDLRADLGDRVDTVGKDIEQVAGIANDAATKAEFNQLAGNAVTKTEFNQLTGTFVTKPEFNQLTGRFVTKPELNELTGRFVTKTEINELTGRFVTKPEFNELTGTFVTKTEINQLTGRFVTKPEFNELTGRIVTRPEFNRSFQNVLTHERLDASLRPLIQDHVDAMLQDVVRKPQFDEAIGTTRQQVIDLSSKVDASSAGGPGFLKDIFGRKR